MKNYLLVRFFGLVFISCTFCSANAQNKSADCVENAAFKKIFFEHIGIIDKNVFANQDQAFKNSLRFISKYAHVSFNKTLNYANLYPVGIYKDDKAGWLNGMRITGVRT